VVAVTIVDADLEHHAVTHKTLVEQDVNKMKEILC
jgi:hypothetical protein